MNGKVPAMAAPAIMIRCTNVVVALIVATSSLFITLGTLQISRWRDR